MVTCFSSAAAHISETMRSLQVKRSRVKWVKRSRVKWVKRSRVKWGVE